MLYFYSLPSVLHCFLFFFRCTPIFRISSFPRYYFYGEGKEQCENEEHLYFASFKKPRPCHVKRSHGSGAITSGIFANLGRCHCFPWATCGVTWSSYARWGSINSRDQWGNGEWYETTWSGEPEAEKWQALYNLHGQTDKGMFLVPHLSLFWLLFLLQWLYVYVILLLPYNRQ